MNSEITSSKLAIFDAHSTESRPQSRASEQIENCFESIPRATLRPTLARKFSPQEALRIDKIKLVSLFAECSQPAGFAPVAAVIPVLFGMAASIAVGETWGVAKGQFMGPSAAHLQAIQPMLLQYDQYIGGQLNVENACLDKDFYRQVHGMDHEEFNTMGSWAGLVSAPWWNTGYYKSRFVDLGGQNPALHMWTVGLDEGRQLSPHFDPKYYFERQPDVNRAYKHLVGRDRHVALLQHYSLHGLKEGRRASRDCCSRAYLERYPHVNELVQGNRMAGVIHLYKFGLADGLSPAPHPDPFDQPVYPSSLSLNLRTVFVSTRWMREVHGFEYKIITDRYLHFWDYADQASQSPGPWYDPVYYRDSQGLGNSATDKQVLHHFLEVGLPGGAAGSAAFDPGYYLQANGDVAVDIEKRHSGQNLNLGALIHWSVFGIGEGRPGSASFNHISYHHRNADVGPVLGHDQWGALRHHFQFRHFDPRPLF